MTLIQGLLLKLNLMLLLLCYCYCFFVFVVVVVFFVVVVIVVISFIQVSGRLYVKKRVASKEQYILSFNLRKMFCFVFCFVLFLCRERKLYSWNSNGKSSVIPSATPRICIHFPPIPTYFVTIEHNYVQEDNGPFTLGILAAIFAAISSAILKRCKLLAIRRQIKVMDKYHIGNHPISEKNYIEIRHPNYYNFLLT